MYNVGDKVVYPMHGAGVIDAIEEKEILGEKQSYYILKMPGEVKVMVPIDKAAQIGVRNIINKEEATKVLDVLEAEETEMPNNWNKRYQENMLKMKIVVISDSFKGSLSSGEIVDIFNNVKDEYYKDTGLLMPTLKIIDGVKYDFQLDYIKRTVGICKEPIILLPSLKLYTQTETREECDLLQKRLRGNGRDS